MQQARSSIDDWKLILHWPLPLNEIGTVTFGAALAPHIYLSRVFLSWLLIVFGLVMASYCFDAVKGDWRPRITKVPKWQVEVIGIAGLTAFIGLAVDIIATTSILLIPVGFLLGYFILAYNLEWFGGKLHNKYGFALSWGGLTAVGGLFYQTLSLSLVMIPLFLAFTVVGLEEWYLGNTKGPFNVAMESLRNYESLFQNILALRKNARRGVWTGLQLMCWANFFISLTLLVARL